MNLIAIGIIFILAFLLQYAFTYLQLNSFNRSYRVLRSKGRVVIGRQKGAVRAGAISMLAIDEKNKVIDGAVMQGLTVLARFRKFDSFNGIDVSTINSTDCKALRLSKSLTSAILDGVKSFKTLDAGGEIPEIESPFRRLTKKVKIN